MLNLLFDLDGTLVDSGDGITRCLAHALESVGYQPPPRLQLERFIGPSLQDSLAILLETDDSGLLDASVNAYRERYSEIGWNESVVYPGAHECLSVLRSQGLRLVLATSKPEVYATRIVDAFGLARHFDALYGSELSGERAHKPALLAHLLASEGIDAGASLMIGDREHDVRGARANRIRAIAVSWGYGDRLELERSDPELIVDSFADLRVAVNTLMSGSQLGP